MISVDNLDGTEALSTAGYVVVCRNDTSTWTDGNHWVQWCDCTPIAIGYAENPDNEPVLLFAWVCFRHYEIEIQWPKQSLPDPLPPDLFANPIMIRGPPGYRRSQIN